MATPYERPHSKITIYTPKDNVDGHGNSNTTATASQINIHPELPTVAVAPKKRDGFAIGDILLVEKENPKTHKIEQVIVLATDVGGLPHGHVDFAIGNANEKLGVTLKGNSVVKSDGTDDPHAHQGFKVTVLGHLPGVRNRENHDAQHRPAGNAKTVLDTIIAINKGEKTPIALETLEQKGILEHVNVMERVFHPPSPSANQPSGLSFDQSGLPSGMPKFAVSNTNEVTPSTTTFRVPTATGKEGAFR
jgi:hypothetical protein